MISKKTAIRVVALILALLMLGGVVITAVQVLASAAYVDTASAALAVNAPGDTFSILVIIVFFIALAVLIAFGLVYIIKRRKK